jgi:hypothetical protein
MKSAAGFLIAALLVATGWAAEKVYQKVANKSYYVELEKPFSLPMKLPDDPDGSESAVTVSMALTTIPENAPPGSVEKAKKHHEEMKQLIAQKKYKFIKTFEGASGHTEYVYQFTYADGEQSAANFEMRLEDVASWEDILQKRKERQQMLNEKISKAIAAGRFRLLDVEPLVIHVCTQTGSEQKILVSRIGLRKEIASVWPEAAKTPVYQTSWQDHLKSVQQGERVLLDLQIIGNYTYEITLDDGSTTIFKYGGNEPLKKPGG